MNNPNENAKALEAVRRVAKEIEQTGAVIPSDLRTPVEGETYELDLLEAHGRAVTPAADENGNVPQAVGFIEIGEITLSALCPSKVALSEYTGDKSKLIRCTRGTRGLARLMSDEHIDDNGKGKVKCVFDVVEATANGERHRYLFEWA